MLFCCPFFLNHKVVLAESSELRAAWAVIKVTIRLLLEQIKSEVLHFKNSRRR